MTGVAPYKKNSSCGLMQPLLILLIVGLVIVHPVSHAAPGSSAEALAAATLSKQLNIDEIDIRRIHVARYSWPDNGMSASGRAGS